MGIGDEHQVDAVTVQARDIALGSVTGVGSTPKLLVALDNQNTWVLTQVDCYASFPLGSDILAPVILIDLSSGTMDLLLLGVSDNDRGWWEAHWTGRQVLPGGNLTATNVHFTTGVTATVTCSGQLLADRQGI